MQAILAEPKAGKRRRKRRDSVFKIAIRSNWFVAFAGWAASGYLRFVQRTSTLTFDPPDAYGVYGKDMPAIIAMWHGQHLMVPFFKRDDFHVSVLISRHRDGEINARVAESFGIGTIRASAARDRSRAVEKGGVRGFMEMKATLAEGRNVAMTADLSNVEARKVGLGIVILSRASGRPVMPIAVASSRFIVLKNWDETTVNLPFSKGICVFGTPVFVPADADDAMLEQKRQEIEASLNDATVRAYAHVGARPGGRDKVAGEPHG
jgi:lysophospholipid acyltransferase (LPLAT)-like uncharacterized protein